MKVSLDKALILTTKVTNHSSQDIKMKETSKRILAEMVSLKETMVMITNKREELTLLKMEEVQAKLQEE